MCDILVWTTLQTCWPGSSQQRQSFWSRVSQKGILHTDHGLDSLLLEGNFRRGVERYDASSEGLWQLQAEVTKSHFKCLFFHCESFISQLIFPFCSPWRPFLFFFSYKPETPKPSALPPQSSRSQQELLDSFLQPTASFYCETSSASLASSVKL